MRIKFKTDKVQSTYYQSPSLITNYNVEKTMPIQLDEFYQVDLAQVINFVKPDEVDENGESIYSQGAIRCRLLYIEQYKDEKDLIIMIPRDPFIDYTPIEGQIVLCSKHPSFEFLDVKQGINLDQYYYFNILNILNNQNHNAVLASSVIGLQQKPPDQNSRVYGQNFYYDDKVKKMDAVPGDIKISGRYGHSLKFTHSLGKDNKKRLPLIIISNNYTKINNNKDGARFESLNNCGSLIILQQAEVQPEQKIQISSSRQLLNEIKNFSLKGNSIVLNSDSIVINSKKNNIQIYAKQNIGLSSQSNIILETKTVKIKSKSVIIQVGENKVIIDSKGVSIISQKITLNGTTKISGIGIGEDPGFCSLPKCLFTGAPHTINSVGTKQ